jgi:hypothetical protein
MHLPSMNRTKATASSFDRNSTLLRSPRRQSSSNSQARSNREIRRNEKIPRAMKRKQESTGAQISRKPDVICITIKTRLASRGGARHVENWTQDDWATAVRRPDRRLINTLVRAHVIRALVENGQIKTVDALGSLAGVNRNDARNLLRLSMMAPSIQCAILEGRQPIGLSAKSITQLELSTAWRDQRRQLAMPGSGHLET